MKLEPHKYLENLLTHWEELCDMCYVSAALHQARPDIYTYSIPLDGPLLHARTLRKHILSSEITSLDREKYMLGVRPEFTSEWLKRSGSFFHFPEFLFDWCRHSRRIYRDRKSVV